MSELRKDPLVDRWVIIAAERGRRPDDFHAGEAPARGEGGPGCAFCEGNEAKTPAETWALRPEGSPPNGPGWRIRVVPNKFPALQIEGEVRRRGLGIFDHMSGIGAHEVVIESPRHDWRMSQAPPAEIEPVLRACQTRLVDLYGDHRFRYVVIFRNYGPQAGASLGHPHSQLIAVPITPKEVKDKLNSAREYYGHKERCIFCDIIDQELMLGDRVVVEDDHFVALSPFAARFPFELAIYPKQHQHDFSLLDDERRSALAQILHVCLHYLAAALGNPAYNYIINTAPNTVPRPGKSDYWGTVALDYHWHLEILPRITRQAGFEYGTGFYINPVAPEDAADFLRETMAEGIEAKVTEAVDTVGTQ
jgi:UDPglucose--hexose-1-phosphate uridylyltransferase